MGFIIAGRSDKYGQVGVEKIGNTGFDDPNEPIAVFRAQDKHAMHVMTTYAHLLANDPTISLEQKSSVDNQIEAFWTWRNQNLDKIRRVLELNKRVC